MLRTLYRGAAVLAAPALRVMLDRRARRGKEWSHRLGERRGIDATPRPSGRLIWLHAASVGETVSVLPVLAALARIAPDVTVLMTTGTVTSATLLGSRLPEMGLEHRVMHRFVPLDVPAWVARFLGHWRPDAAAFVESEIWPNLLAGCAASHIPMMLLKARLSDGSFARWRRAGSLARSLFGQFDRVLARDGTDAARLRALGARDVIEAGDLKFAAAPLPVPRIELERLRRRLAGRPVWLAASTHPGEEAMVVDLHRRLAAGLPGLLTILAPRHPQRGEEVAALACELPMTRRGAGDDPPETSGIWIADSVGEYGLLFSLAGLCFMGGSLVPLGGHNPLEPARLGCAVAIGPHTANFRDAVTVLEAAGALAQVVDAVALGVWVEELLSDESRRRTMGEAGIAASYRFAGLPQRVAAMLLDLVGASA
jgi:3-deoxy-D-manno-octulosonic-acid transferase